MYPKGTVIAKFHFALSSAVGERRSPEPSSGSSLETTSTCLHRKHSIRIWKTICNIGRKCVPNSTSCIPHLKLGVCEGKSTFSGFSQIVMGNRVETNGNCVSIGFHGFPSRGNRPIACRDGVRQCEQQCAAVRAAVCGSVRAWPCRRV